MKKILIAMSGTLFSQIIPIIIAPVLSRIYEPNVFGYYSVYIAISTTLYTIIVLAFDQSISVSENIYESITLFKLVIILIGLFCIVFIPLLFVFRVYIGNLLNINIYWIIPFIPIYSFLYAIYMCCYFFYLRWGEIKANAKLKIYMSFFVVTSNLLFSLFYKGDASLIISQLIAYIILIFFQIKPLYKCYKKQKALFNNIYDAKVTIYKIILKYKQFPLKFMPSILLNTLSIQMPSIFLNSFFGSTIAGYYSLVNRTLNAPVAAIGNAFGDVYRNDAYNEYQMGNSLKILFSKSMKILLKLSIVPFLLLFIISPQLFAFIFGPDWINAGIMSSIMTPLYFAKFVAVPLVFTLIVFNKHTFNFILQIALFICCLFSFLIGGLIFTSWQVTLIPYVISFFIIYAIYVLYSYKLVTSKYVQ
ncbi:MAG: lipopolysaccharide biosynthesis protein [Eubacteriales bacterium]